MTPKNPDTRLLLVEDDPISRGQIHVFLRSAGYQLVDAADCAAARRALASGAAYDAILLDRGLPDGDGLSLVADIRAVPALRDVPVILQTARADAASIRQGIEAGVFFYLTKPLDRKLLQTVVRTAVSALHEQRAQRQGASAPPDHALALLAQGRFELRSLDEARQLARAVAPRCPEPEAALTALQELLVNAIEHGNLGISYVEKSQLLQDNVWEAEIERRLADPVLGARRVTLELQQSADEVRVTITDQGAGFDWRPFLDLSTERMFDAHGRGIAMAAMSGSAELRYSGRGNVVSVRWQRVGP